MKNILLVEDDQFLANLIKARLEKIGSGIISVQIARDGQEALSFLQESGFDLISLDLILPKISGFEILKVIQKDPGRLQAMSVIILSNLAQENDIKEALALGAAKYFVKAQISIDELVEEIKKILKL